jgi:DUF4097 and DUF4098 domain-containing protein YvlB
MKIYATILFILILLCLTYSSEFTETRTLRLPAEGIERLEVDCGAGYLQLNGAPDLEEIVVDAEIIVSGVEQDRASEAFEEHVELNLRKQGKNAVLISEFIHSGSFFSAIFGGKSQVIINLKVKVPRKMDLEIDDGSGYVEIKDLEGEVYVDDGSGELTITNILGDVSIDDGSGEMSLEEISGNIKIDDGSGEISVRKIKGDVQVDDGSGTIYFDNIDGDVAILDDGSGEVHLKNVTGRVIRRD